MIAVLNFEVNQAVNQEENDMQKPGLDIKKLLDYNEGRDAAPRFVISGGC